MTEIGLLMILAALWGAPSGAGQANFQIDFSGDNHRSISCKGKVNFDIKPGKEILRFQQNCTGAGPQDENREEILRFDQHKTYLLNHALKSYRVDELKPLPEVLKDVLKGAAPVKPIAFLEGTQLWLQPTGRDFWLMRVQDPAQQGRFSEIHLMAPGYGSHLYLSYTAAAKDNYEPPKEYHLGGT